MQTEMNMQIPAMNQAVEVIRLIVSPENTAAFLEGRAEVEKFTRTLAGHLSTELLHLGDTNWLMLIRWESEESVRAAQQLTATAPVISDWLNRTAQFVSFDTGLIRYVS
jgi:antibiotic biosynthesis monooxygenase (ABM) superfamily enzyme